MRGTQNPGHTGGKGASRPASARTATAATAATAASAASAASARPAAGRRARPQSAAPQLYHSVGRSSVAPSAAAALPMGQTKRHLQQLQSDIAVVRGLQ